MSKQDDIKECKRRIEIYKNDLAVEEAKLKKLEEKPEEVVFNKLTFRVHGVGVGVYKNGYTNPSDMIEYLASWFDGNEVKILRDFLSEKIKAEGSE